MKKLPDVSNGKGDDACVKEKKIFPFEKGDDMIFFSGSVRRTNNTILLSGVLGTTLHLGTVGGVCNLVISVDLLSKLFPPQIQHKTLQSRERNGIEHNEH